MLGARSAALICGPIVDGSQASKQQQKRNNCRYSGRRVAPEAHRKAPEATVEFQKIPRKCSRKGCNTSSGPGRSRKVRSSTAENPGRPCRKPSCSHTLDKGFSEALAAASYREQQLSIVVVAVVVVVVGLAVVVVVVVVAVVVHRGDATPPRRRNAIFLISHTIQHGRLQKQQTDR